jgi:hypothetical protein
VAGGCYRPLVGNRPPKAGKRTGHGHGADVGVCAACPQVPRAPTAPARGLPTAVLEALGRAFQAQWQRPTACGRIPGGPGAVAQSPARRGGPRFGNRPLPAMVARRGRRGHQPQECPQCSWGRKTRPGAAVGPHGDGPGALPAPQGLAGRAHGRQTPPVPRGW